MLHLTHVPEAEIEGKWTERPRGRQLTRDELIALYREAYEAALDHGHWLPAQALRMRLKALER